MLTVLDILLVWSSVSLEVNPFKESLLLFSSDFLFSCIHPLHSFTRCLFPLTFRVLVLFFFLYYYFYFLLMHQFLLWQRLLYFSLFLHPVCSLIWVIFHLIQSLPADQFTVSLTVPAAADLFFFFPFHLLNIDHCVHHVRPVLCCLSVFICECLTSVSSRMLWRKTGL